MNMYDDIFRKGPFFTMGQETRNQQIANIVFYRISHNPTVHVVLSQRGSTVKVRLHVKTSVKYFIDTF